MQHFNILAGLCRLADWFESYLFRNTKEGFSCITAHYEGVQNIITVQFECGIIDLCALWHRHNL